MALDDDIRALSRVELFAEFSQDQLRLLAFGAETLRFAPGRELYREGNLADSAYVIVDGAVDLYRDVNGVHTVVGHAGKGSILGGFALIAEARRSMAPPPRSRPRRSASTESSFAAFWKNIPIWRSPYMDSWRTSFTPWWPRSRSWRARSTIERALRWASDDAIFDAHTETIMRTTVTLDDELVNTAKKYTGIEETSALVTEALRSIVAREAGRRLAALGGSDPDAKTPPRRRFR